MKLRPINARNVYNVAPPKPREPRLVVSKGMYDISGRICKCTVVLDKAVRLFFFVFVFFHFSCACFIFLSCCFRRFVLVAKSYDFLNPTEMIDGTAPPRRAFEGTAVSLVNFRLMRSFAESEFFYPTDS